MFLIYSLLLCSLCLNIYLIFIQSTQSWLNELINFNSPTISSSDAHSGNQNNKEQIVQSAQPDNLNSLTSNIDSAIIEAQHAIDTFDYHQAILVLESLSSNDAVVLKHYWMNHSKAQINQKAFNEAEYSLNAFLEYELDNVDFHDLYI